MCENSHGTRCDVLWGWGWELVVVCADMSVWSGTMDEWLRNAEIDEGILLRLFFFVSYGVLLLEDTVCQHDAYWWTRPIMLRNIFMLSTTDSASDPINFHWSRHVVETYKLIFFLSFKLMRSSAFPLLYTHTHTRLLPPLSKNAHSILLFP